MGEVELAVVNSLGVEAYQNYSDLFLHLIVENGKNTGYASFVSRDPDPFDVELWLKEANQKGIQEEPVRIEPGEYEVILEPYAVSELLVLPWVLSDFTPWPSRRNGVSSAISLGRRWWMKR